MMKLENLISLLLVLFLFISSCIENDSNTTKPSTTTGIIKGKITEASTGNIIEGANVYTMPATVSTTTDATGNYMIENVAPGQYIVVAGKDNYNGNCMILVIEGQITTADIPLIQNPLPDLPDFVSPVTNATGQAINIQLIWSCSDPEGDPLTYYVYVDSVCPPRNIVAENHQDTYVILRDLVPNKTYCWMIVVKDDKGGIRIGPEWKFTTSTKLFTESWDISEDYSITDNPNDLWSYGRKWTADGSTFDIFTTQWGGAGWYFGNVGHGGPSIIEGPPDIINLWAKNNSNGLPCVRWISPKTGIYNIYSSFIGGDSRGVNVVVYIAINNAIIFTDYVTSYRDSTGYSLDVFELDKGDYIDFLIKWNGVVYSEYNWTSVDAIINRY